MASSSNNAEKSSKTPQLAPLSAADLSSAGFLSDFLGLTPAASSSNTVKSSNPVKTYQVSCSKIMIGLPVHLNLILLARER